MLCARMRKNKNGRDMPGHSHLFRALKITPRR